MAARSDPDALMRIFIALELPQAWQVELIGTMQRLKDAGLSPVRWVRPEGIHLTLKFLGEVSPAQSQDVQRTLERTIESPLGIELGLGQIGTFGGPNRTRVIWVGLTGQTELLTKLGGTIDDALSAIGFAREERPLRPHLTLGRVADSAKPDERRRINDLASITSPPKPTVMRFGEVSLMRSLLQSGGARYERLAGYPHQAPNSEQR